MEKVFLHTMLRVKTKQEERALVGQQAGDEEEDKDGTDEELMAVL